MRESRLEDLVQVHGSEIVEEYRLLGFASFFAFGALDLYLSLGCFLRSVPSLEGDGRGRRRQVWTLLGCRKPSALPTKSHASAVSSMRLRTKLATCRVKRDEKSGRAGNAFMNIVHCVHRLILQSTISY